MTPPVFVYNYVKSERKRIYNIYNYLLTHKLVNMHPSYTVLIDFPLTVKAATVIFISGRGSAISSAKQGKSGSIYNLVKN